MAPSSLGALVLIVAVASSSWVMVARASTYDGLPRTRGFPDAPTSAYGAFPTVYVRGTNQIADCQWYGFANVNFPANIGQQCLTYLRTAIVGEANQNTLTPYTENYCYDAVCFDRVAFDNYCFQACYYLSNSSLAIPPVTAPAAPPPPVVVTAPPAALLPPPGTPAALVPPPGGGIIGQPPPAPAAPRTTSAGSRSSLQAHAPSVVLLAFCAAAGNLVIRL